MAGWKIKSLPLGGRAGGAMWVAGEASRLPRTYLHVGEGYGLLITSLQLAAGF